MRNYLVTLRKEKNYTQKQFAEKLDISESYYNQIENGERQKNMDVSLLCKISTVLNIPIVKLFEYEKKHKEEE